MRPQSLQMLQQATVERLESIRRLQGHYPYGLVEMELASDALEAGKIRFKRLHAILPTGLEVVVPGPCEIESFPVREELARSPLGEVTILLGVPDHSWDHPNAFKASAKNDLVAKYRFAVRSDDVADENTGDNRHPVEVRLLNARLLFEHEDRSGLECLPLVRVRRAGGGAEFRVEIMSTVAPPCRWLSAWPSLTELVRLAVQRVEAARRSGGRSLRSEKASLDALKGGQVVRVIRQLALARHSARLTGLLHTPHLTPYEAFLALYEATLELEVLRPRLDPGARRDVRDLYDHENPYPGLNRLAERLERALRDTGEVNYIAVDFAPEPQEPDRVRCTLKPEFFGASVLGYFLGVQTTRDPIRLAEMLQDTKRFEVTVPAYLGQQYGGIPLRYVQDPPGDFPETHHYFALERDSVLALWNEKVESDRQQGRRTESLDLGIIRQRSPLDLSDAAFALYATLQPRTPEADDAD